MSSNQTAGLLLVGTLALAGCGGGGGGGGSGDTVDSAATLPITGDNAVDVASASYRAASMAASADSSAMVVLQSAQAGSDGGAHFSLAGFADRQLRRVMEMEQQVVAASVYSDTYNCAISGTFDAAWNDADNDNTFSNGDTFQIAFSNCSDSTGQAVNGAVSISNLTTSGNYGSYPFSMGATITLTDLKVTEDPDVTTMNGSFGLSDSTQDGVEESVAITNGSLSASGTEGTTPWSATLSGFQSNTTYDNNTATYALTTQGNLDANESTAAGTASFTTPAAFKGSYMDAYPSEGQFKVVGAANSSLTLTALDSTNVRLEIDDNGDGVTDGIIDTTWTEID